MTDPTTRPPLGTPEIEAAKFLRDMALDFIKDRSAAHVVDEAVRNWLAVRHVPACPRCGRWMLDDDGDWLCANNHPAVYVYSAAHDGRGVPRES